MKIRKAQTIVAFVLLVTLTIGGIWPATAQDSAVASQERVASSGEFVPGEILVKFKAGASANSVQAALDRYDATYVETVYGSEVAVWRVPEGYELIAVNDLNTDPAVAYAEPNYIYYAFDLEPNTPDLTPNDPEFGKQWGHQRIRSEMGWNITTGSSGITIAIIDSGVDLGHPDLVSKLVSGYDHYDGDADPSDTNGHGTHVAGIAAAATNNGVGGVGMDWNARIMPIRALGTQGSGPTSAIVAGINWAYANGAKVLNMSLGGPSYSTSMQDAVNAATAAGSLVVAAMGNDNVSTPFYPAAYDNVMAVSATGPSDAKSSFSNYGSHCDIAAPGGDMGYYHDPNGIYSTMPTYPVHLTTNYSYYNNYDYLHGTSQASPFVAGLAALVWAANPGASPADVQQTIEDTAKDLGTAGKDDYFGYGLIDVYAALQSGAVPAAPVLAPIDNMGSGDYVVDWSDVSGATSYSLQEANNPAFTGASIIYSGASSQHAVTGKAAGTTWYYRARATNANGTGPWSNIRSATVKPAAPALSAISNASNADAYKVQWAASTGATSYTLEEANNASFTGSVVRYMGTAMEYNVTGQRGGTWHYRVRAANSGGDSPWSTSQSTTVDPPALSPPPILDDISNPSHQNAYLVNWSDVPTTSVTYTLEESIDPYFTNPTVVYTGGTSQYQVTAQPGGTWYYRVRAAGQYGRSAWSLTKSTTVNTKIFLPVVAKTFSITPPATGPKPGSWLENTSGCSACSRFQVSSDSAYVQGFTIRVRACNVVYEIVYEDYYSSPLSIANSAFSFTGSYYGNGTFTSSTEVSGTYGLSNHDLPGCSNVSGGPWDYTSVWTSAATTSPIFTAETGYRVAGSAP